MAPEFGTDFNFARPWAEKFRVIVPFHPGFGESGDDPALSDMHDYVMHYLDLFDALGIDKFRLVGFSLGGWLAAKFASEHGHRVERLVLVGPAGLRGKEQPKGDFFTCRRSRFRRCWFRISTSSSRICRKTHDLDFMGARYREGGTLARLLWEHPYDRKLPRYLHRLTMPTMLVWGEDDGSCRFRPPSTGAGTFPKRKFRPSRARVTWSSTRSGKLSTRYSASCPDLNIVRLLH